MSYLGPQPGELPFKVNYSEGGEALVKEFATNDEAHAFRKTLIPPVKAGLLPTRMAPDRASEAVAEAQPEQK